MLRLHVRAVLALARARLLLRRVGTTATLRRLTGRSPNGSGVDPDAALHAIRRAARVVGGECLPQAVALAALLRGDGPELILGCRRDQAEGWLAHAWVEQGDKVLNPAGPGGFVPLARLNRRTGWVPGPLDAKS